MTKSLTVDKPTRTYSQWRLEKLSDPARAARYLNAAKKDSKEAFLYALKNVIQAREVTKVAKEAGVSRESIYRSFSAEGNPTYDTFSSILEAVDIDFSFAPMVHSISESQSGPLAAGTSEAEILNGSVPKLSFMAVGAVRYFLPGVINVLPTGDDLNFINLQVDGGLSGAVYIHPLNTAASRLVNVKDNVSAAIQYTIQPSGTMVSCGTIDKSQNAMIGLDWPVSRSTAVVREPVNA